MGENAFQPIEEDVIFCPECGSRNQIGNAFCAECGTKLPAKAGHSARQAEKTKDAAVMQPELHDAFATGLAAWDMEPPHIVVRRRNRRK